jgi:hypothetical protein
MYLQNVVSLGNGLSRISQEWDVNISKSTFDPWSPHPGPMTVVAVSWTSNDFTTNLFELFDTRTERDDLSGADKSKVLRIEEKDDIFALVIGQIDVNVRYVIALPDGSFTLNIKKKGNFLSGFFNQIFGFFELRTKKNICFCKSQTCLCPFFK